MLRQNGYIVIYSIYHASSLWNLVLCQFRSTFVCVLGLVSRST